MKRLKGLARTQFFIVIMAAWAAVMTSTSPGSAETKAEKSHHVTVIEGNGTEIDLKHFIFYWEEKVSETSFVPHELRHVPVKRGTATVNVKFDTIKQIDVKPAQEKGPPLLSITLANGKTGEFVLGIPGSFKGESEFGEVEIQPEHLRKIVFK